MTSRTTSLLIENKNVSFTFLAVLPTRTLPLAPTTRLAGSGPECAPNEARLEVWNVHMFTSERRKRWDAPRRRRSTRRGELFSPICWPEGTTRAPLEGTTRKRTTGQALGKHSLAQGRPSSAAAVTPDTATPRFSQHDKLRQGASAWCSEIPFKTRRQSAWRHNTDCCFRSVDSQNRPTLEFR